MTAATLEAPVLRPAVLRPLVVREMRRYASHPLFVVGALLVVVSCLGEPDGVSSSLMNVVVPAAAIGLLGVVVMASLTRRSGQLRESAGVPPVPERTQTVALAWSAAVPFAVGLAWFAWASLTYHQQPPTAAGYPFGDVPTGWAPAVLFGCGAMSTLGGPLLGLLLGRWWPRRGVAIVVSVVLVAAAIVMQGVVAPLRGVRTFMPFTYWGGPFGVEGDDMRALMFPGSPQWWVVYLAGLCGLCVVGALWHDPGARSRRLRLVAVSLVVLTVVACLLSALTGLDHTLVNPVPTR